MGSLIKILLAILVLFSISAGVSWYLQSTLKKPDDHEKTAAEAHPKAKEPKAHDKASQEKEHEPAPSKPAFRPVQVHDANVISGMAANLKQQSEALRQCELQLNNRQKNLDLVYQDLRTERTALEDFRKQIEDEMKALNDKIEHMDKREKEQAFNKQKMESDLKEIKKSLLEVEDVETGRIKQMSAMYDSMEAEAAAQTFQQMVESGKLDMAVKILAGMRERQAAKVLSQLPNQTISVQILDRLKTLKSTIAKTKTS